MDCSQQVSLLLVLWMVFYVVVGAVHSGSSASA